MMAAITAASKGAKVTIIEHKDRIGKKILATGNGKCNFTNLLQKRECYRSDNYGFVWNIYEQFDVNRTLSFFEEIGVYAKEKNGYVYPNSEQASAVLDALRMELDRLKVEILTETKCKEIRTEKKGFRVMTDKGDFSADALILSTGSKASPVTGSDGSGYSLAKQMGLHMVPVLPALVQLRCKEKFYKSISGVRVQAEVSILSDKKLLGKDTGELQLTNYGISGIPVFQVSRYAAKALYEEKEVKAVLNFMPGFTEKEFEELLIQRMKNRPEKMLEEFFVGMFHKKLSDLWISLSHINRGKKAGQLSVNEIKSLVKLIQHFETQVTDTNGFEQAQICCGGIDTRELNPLTLEVYSVPGLYLTGELLDVDGICGGYNLQWAWSSGYVAGREAADASY
ncbi:MAG: NAD(P)/FAD-dependent oxidoreductase [Ruminococcus sp.]|nr:NAD(P)/FAD-dependent oxidoreductase [Ruminococcus sp.]